MEGIAFLLVMITIGMLLRWLIVHDERPNERTRGLFAMVHRIATKAPTADSLYRSTDG